MARGAARPGGSGGGDGPPAIRFTFDEAIVIYLARPFLEPLAGTHLWDAAQSAFRKIRATLTENSIAYLERFPHLFHYTTAGFADYRSKAGIIDELSVAIEDQKAIRIAYQSQHARDAANRRVYPYGLARHKGALYLVALAPDHDQVRHHKVNRIESLAVESRRFERPADFDVAKHFARSFGVYEGDDDVTVEFNALRTLRKPKTGSDPPQPPRPYGARVLDSQRRAHRSSLAPWELCVIRKPDLTPLSPYGARVLDSRRPAHRSSSTRGERCVNRKPDLTTFTAHRSSSTRRERCVNRKPDLTPFMSSQAIAWALESGLEAARAIDASFRDDLRALCDYARWVDSEFAGYLSLRWEYYRRERRWPDSPFWRRRQTPPLYLHRPVRV
jgi:hypothetical protein